MIHTAHPFQCNKGETQRRVSGQCANTHLTYKGIVRLLLREKFDQLNSVWKLFLSMMQAIWINKNTTDRLWRWQKRLRNKKTSHRHLIKKSSTSMRYFLLRGRKVLSYNVVSRLYRIRFTVGGPVFAYFLAYLVPNYFRKYCVTSSRHTHLFKCYPLLIK